MSYILDALNKSERDRERNQPPRLTSVHHQPGRRAPWWRWFIGLLVLAVLNTLLVGYWMRDEPAGPTERDTSSERKQAEVEKLPTDGTPESRAASTTTAPQGELITPPDIGSTQPVRISTLPADVQKQIPDLSFTSHIYSSDPSLRAVTINGRQVREGESLGNELTLVEITEDGVILRYRHYTLDMSVIRDWSFD